MPFDINGARKAGYSDEQISEFLSSNNPSFDVSGAQKAGYTLDDIAGTLAQPKQQQDTQLPTPEQTGKVINLPPIPEITQAKPMGFMEQAGRFMSPLLGPTEAQKIEEAVPFGKTATGETKYEYKPLASRLEQEQGIFTPFITTPQLQSTPTDTTAEAIGKGAFNVGAGVLGSFMSPGGVLLGGVPKELESAAEGVKQIGRGAAGLFAGQMLGAIPGQVQEAINPNLPLQERIQGGLGAVVGLGFGGLAAKHAIMGEKRPSPENIPGPAPEVAPSTVPGVDSKEAAIISKADDLHEVPSPPSEVTGPTINIPAATSEELNRAKISDLVAQQLEHEEGSPEHTAIQQQIDALQKPAEKTQFPDLNEWTENQKQYLQQLEQQKPAEEISNAPENDLDKQLQDLTDEQNRLVIDELPKYPEGSIGRRQVQDRIDAIRLQQVDLNKQRELVISEETKPAEAPAEAKPKEENAVQVEKTGEVGVRNAPTVGEGVGAENKPEVPATEGEEKPKEEVAPITENSRTTNRDYSGYPKGTQVEIVSRSKDPLSTDVKIKYPDGKIDSFPEAWLKKPKTSATKPKETLPSLVKTRGRDAVNDLLNEWNEAELSPDGKYILGVVDPRSSMKPERIPVREFLDWLQDKESTSKVEVGPEADATTPTIETTGEGQLFREDALPFNLAGEELPPEPEKPTVGTEEEQQLPMGETPKPTEPEKPSNPYKDLLNKVVTSIKTHSEFANEAEKVAKKTRNKFLQESVDNYRDAMEIGADMESEFEKLLADVEREANYHDQGIKPSERGLPKSRYRKPQYFGGKNGDEVIRYLQENKILPKKAWEKKIRESGRQVTGGEYDDMPEIPQKHSKTLYGTNGEGQVIDDALTGLHSAGLGLNIETVPELWQYIKDASDSALKEEKETTEQSRIEKKIETEREKMRKLAQKDPEKYASEMDQDLRDYFNARRGDTGGFLEFPDSVKEAATNFGKAIYKAGMTFRDWSREMISRLGNGVRDFLRQIWNAWSSTGRSGGIGRIPGEDEAALRARIEREKYGPPSPQEAYANKLYDALTKTHGSPATEEELSRGLSSKFPGITSREITDLYNKASGKAEARPSVTAPETGGEGRTTGLKRATVSQERLARGLEELNPEERPGAEEAVANAVEKNKDTTASSNLVANILEGGKRNISHDDAALLLAERNRVLGEQEKWQKIYLDEKTNDVERANAENKLNEIESQLDRLDKAQKIVGTQWSDIGRLYQRLIAEDNSIQAIQTRWRKAKGSSLSPEENIQISDLSKRLTDLQKKYEELQNKINETKSDGVKETLEKTIKDLEDKLAKSQKEKKPTSEKQPKEGPKYSDKIINKISSLAEQARERKAKRRAEGRFMSGYDPAEFADDVIIASEYIAHGVKNAADFAIKIKNELGDVTKEYIDKLYKAANEKIKQLDKSESSDDVRARVKAEAVAGDELSQKSIYDLVVAHLQEGLHEENEVMNAVLDDVKEAYPEATIRDVRRAYTNYGKYKFPSKDEILTRARELRTLSRLQESIDRLNEGLRPLKTGLQRDKAIQEIREKQKQLNDLLAKANEPTREQFLASRSDAAKTRLRNAIEDLDKQLRTGERPTPRERIEEDPEVEQLRSEKEAMQRLRNEIDRQEAPKDSPEEKENERLRKLYDKQIADLDEKLRGIEKPKPEKPTFEQSRENEQKMAERDAMREKLKEIEKEEADRKKPSSEQAEIDRIQKAIDDVNDRIAKGEKIAPTPKKEPLTEYARRLREDLEKARKQYKRVTGKEPKTPEQRYNEARQKAWKKKIDELNDRIKRGDFKEAPKKPTPKLNEESRKVFSELEKTKQEAKEAEQKLAFENRTPVQKLIDRVIKAPWHFLTAIKVLGHGTVGMLTHAGGVLWRPTRALIYWKNFLRQFPLWLSPKYHEKIIYDLIHDKDFQKWKDAGASIDPREEYTDYGMYAKWMGKFAAGGKRGFDALNLVRLELNKKDWENVSDDIKANPEQAEETRKYIAALNNKATGALPKGYSAGRQIARNPLMDWLFFAPKLYATRFSRVLFDPVRTIKTFGDWSNSTPAEKYIATKRLKNAGEFAATYIGALMINQAILSATGSKQQVNFTDPSKTDWLKMKIGNKVVMADGGLLDPIRLIGRIVYGDLIKPRTEREVYLKGNRYQQAMKDLTEYVRGKMNPTLGIITDVSTGTDFQGRPLPGPLARGEKAKYADQPQYTWKEWLLEQGPIPLSGATKDVYESMREKGLSDVQAQDILKGAALTAVGMTGAHAQEDYSLLPKTPPKLRNKGASSNPFGSTDSSTKSQRNPFGSF